MLNGNSLCSANISLYSVHSVYSSYSVYSVFYSVYSVILINSANTLVYSVHSVCIVRYSVLLNSLYSVYSDLFNFLYSVTLFINCISRLLGELNGMLLDIMNWSRGRSRSNWGISYSRGEL